MNRSITGAIVNRQPFGGWKASSIGATAKAGGPSYVSTLRLWTESPISSVSIAEPEISEERFALKLRTLATSESDPTGLRSEANILRYRKLPKGVLLRIGDVGNVNPKNLNLDSKLHAERAETLARIAAKATGTPLSVSLHTEESEDECIRRLQASRPDRLRIVGTASDALRIAANELGIRIDECPIVPDARVEITRWTREQAISTTLHRHGRLVEQ